MEKRYKYMDGYISRDLLPRGGGGTRKNLDRDARVTFFGFEI